MTSKPARILAVDDEPEMAEIARVVLERVGHEVTVETDGARALELILEGRPDLVVTDLRMPGLDGLALIEQIRARGLNIPVLVLTAYASVDSAVEVMKRGAADYLAKPFTPEELTLRVERALAWTELTEENRYLRKRIESASRHGEIVGESEALAAILRLVDKVAATDARVLLVGESGTGKELIARTLHRHSQRREEPFFAVNCGALSENLLESELFGHERGAFTGAVAVKKGIFEVADGGTLFLDEISETAPAFQTKLLRVLQEGEFLRVGGTRALTTNVRVVSSTNRDPRRSIAEGRLREDLFYRLSVVQIILPPLRERREDIPLLAHHFVTEYARQIKKRIRGIQAEAMEALCRYAWPGNIRELENAIERAIIMADEGGYVGAEHLPHELTGAAAPPSGPAAPMQELRDAEKEILLRALREADWNRSLAAKNLGIGRRTLYDKLARHGIPLRRSGAPAGD
jgi:DNA-binding NtrC family response regulator